MNKHWFPEIFCDKQLVKFSLQLLFFVISNEVGVKQMKPIIEVNV